MITVQYCPCGHIGSSSDAEHINLDRKRQEMGYLDALILPSTECPDCRYDNSRANQYFDDQYEMAGDFDLQE